MDKESVLDILKRNLKMKKTGSMVFLHCFLKNENEIEKITEYLKGEKLCKKKDI